MLPGYGDKSHYAEVEISLLNVLKQILLVKNGYQVDILSQLYN